VPLDFGFENLYGPFKWKHMFVNGGLVAFEKAEHHDLFRFAQTFQIMPPALTGPSNTP
jgi:hypothetical protein